MLYQTLYLIHVFTVAASITLFAVRGLWVFAASPRRHGALARVVPHVIDTFLLASAINLAILLRQYPVEQAWVTAKVVGLLVYIGLGMIALRRRKPWAFILALVTVSYVVAVAVTRNAVPF